MYDRIVIPLDGSHASETIMRYVTDLAQKCNAEVFLMRVVSPPLLLGRDEVIDTQNYHQQFNHETEQATTYLTDWQNIFTEKKVKANIRVVHGAVEDEILNTAQSVDADLIAMASEGIRDHMTPAYGSVAARVLKRANCPLLILGSNNA